MKRIIIIAAALALAACASPRTASIEDGKVSNITSAEAVTLMKQDVRRQKVESIQKNAQPLLKITAKPGEVMTFGGVASIEVHAPLDIRELLAEQPDAVSENVQVLREWRGIARETAVPLGIAGMAPSDRKSARESAERIAETEAETERARDAAQAAQTGDLVDALREKPSIVTVPAGSTVLPTTVPAATQ